MKLFTNLFALGATLLLSTSVFADENYGTLMVSKGEITVTRADGKTEKGRIGLKVYSKDSVTAGKDSRAKIVFVDKNVMNISPESKVVIESYRADSSGDNRGAELSVAYGKIRNTVNQKYDGEKSKFTVKTPSAVAGVRGTDFMVSFSKVSEASKIVTFAGAVDVAKVDKMGTMSEPVRVSPGQYSVTAPTADKPSQPQTLPKNELASLNNETNTDTAGKVEKSDNGRDPASKDSPPDKDNGKGNDDKGAKNDRSPSSDGSMLDSNDLGPQAGGPMPPPNLGPAFGPPVGPDLMRPAIGADFLQDAVLQQNRSNLIINIVY